MEGREVNIIYVTERRSQDKVEEEGHQEKEMENEVLCHIYMKVL